MKRKRPNPRSVAGMNAARTEELVKLMDEEASDEDYKRIKKVMRDSPYGLQKQRETELAKQIFGNAKIRQNIAKQMTDPELVQRRLFDQHATQTMKKYIETMTFPDSYKQQFPDFFDQALYYSIFPPSKLNAITYDAYNIEDLPLTENTVSALNRLSALDKVPHPVFTADPIARLKRLINKWDTEDKERLEAARLEKEAIKKRQLQIEQPQMTPIEYLVLTASNKLGNAKRNRLPTKNN